MLKQVTVTIIVDDHEPEKCSNSCPFINIRYVPPQCMLFTRGSIKIISGMRCKQCLEEAK